MVKARVIGNCVIQNSKDSCWIRGGATERKEIKQNMQMIFRILMATCHSGLHLPEFFGFSVLTLHIFLIYRILDQ